MRGKKIYFSWMTFEMTTTMLESPTKSFCAFGARGSRVIVTTCNTTVASVMRTVPIQYLEQLSDEDCWLLLSKHALPSGNLSANPNLEEIGKNIARKCNGLPSAAKNTWGSLTFQHKL